MIWADRNLEHKFIEEIMVNLVKELTVPKWVLIVGPKIPQVRQNLSAQLVCPSPKVLDFNEKRLHWASVVRGFKDNKLPGSYFLFFLDHKFEICPVLQKIRVRQ
jgi:hypothetical protein